MNAVMTPELRREYDRLSDERRDLLRALNPGPAFAKTQARLEEVGRRIRGLSALPPAGYTLPKLAADLVAFAQACGWLTLVQWQWREFDGDPFVNVTVGRRVVPGEMPNARGDVWKYLLCWHSRNCPPGRMRLFGRGTANTPDKPWCHDAPSLKALRAVIAVHPAPGGVAP